MHVVAVQGRRDVDFDREKPAGAAQIFRIAPQLGALAAAGVPEKKHMPAVLWKKATVFQRKTEFYREPGARLLAAARLRCIDVTRIVRAERFVVGDFVKHLEQVLRRLISHEH